MGWTAAGATRSRRRMKACGLAAKQALEPLRAVRSREVGSAAGRARRGPELHEPGSPRSNAAGRQARLCPPSEKNGEGRALVARPQAQTCARTGPTLARACSLPRAPLHGQPEAGPREGQRPPRRGAVDLGAFVAGLRQSPPAKPSGGSTADRARWRPWCRRCGRRGRRGRRAARWRLRRGRCAHAQAGGAGLAPARHFDGGLVPPQEQPEARSGRCGGPRPGLFCCGCQAGGGDRHCAARVVFPERPWRLRAFAPPRRRFASVTARGSASVAHRRATRQPCAGPIRVSQQLQELR